MRSLPRTFFVLAGVIAAAALQGGASEAAPALQIEPVIWHFDGDYPDWLPGDSGLPIDTVYIKTHDETDWMSTYDDNPNAVSGPAAIQNLINIYAAQGVEVAAWFVPKGPDIDRQVQMAVQVIDSGVTALYADVEPFDGFCRLECRTLAENFWTRVRAERPNARLGVIYDPRTWWWGESATDKWLAVSDAALPMCYWESYAGQVPWGDAAGCVSQARADLSVLAPGRDLDYIPMIQGNSTPDLVRAALDAAVQAESERVSIWRRGVTSTGVWDMISGYTAPSGPHCALNLVDGCLIREASQPETYLVQGGARFWFPTGESFFEMGFDLRDVQVVPLGFTDDIPLAPVDGTLIQEHGDPRLYVTYGGAKFWIPSLEAFYAMGFEWNGVRRVPPGGAAQVPQVPADYSRLREFSGADEYISLHGARIPLDENGVAALTAGGRAGSPQYVLPDGGLDQIPLAEIKRGDADCDGAITVIDSLLVLQESIRVPQAGLCTHISGDVTCDGSPLPDDSLAILLYVSGDPPEAPPGCPPIGEAVPATLPEGTPDDPLGATPTPASSDSPAPQSTEPATSTPTPTPEASASPTETPTPSPVPPASETPTPGP